jgi:hypothetical protein
MAKNNNRLLSEIFIAAPLINPLHFDTPTRQSPYTHVSVWELVKNILGFT